MKSIFPIIFAFLFFVSCNHKAGDIERYDMASMEELEVPVTRQSVNAPPPPPESTENIQTKDVQKKKIIKDGRLGVKVSNLQEAKTGIDSLLKQFNAYYGKERLNNSDWESSFYLKIRIPSANFESFISAIESGNGEILYKEVHSKDVTDQFIDLETRLENKRNYLNRYRALLKKAKTIKEILEIEEKIRYLEEEIESTTGRLKYLNDQVNYSTLELTLTKKKDFKYNPVERDRFGERFKQSMSKGWFGLVDLFLFIIKIWPFWIILGLAIYFVKRYRRKRNKA